jgi:hypothetical protein
MLLPLLLRRLLFCWLAEAISMVVGPLDSGVLDVDSSTGALSEEGAGMDVLRIDLGLVTAANKGRDLYFVTPA